jgi:hypothetical protein
MQDNNEVPSWGNAKDVEVSEVEVEVIEKEDDACSIYKPRICKSAKNACIAGNNLPVLAAVAARGGTKEDFENKVVNFKITDCLKKEMSAPTAYFPGAGSTAEAISKVLINKALAGDLNSIREVLNRTEGKVPNVTQNASVTAKVTGGVSELSDLMKRIDANKG